jgi:hypothetical protein
MPQPVRMIVAALLFAAALIASSYFLRGWAGGDWVDAAVYLGLGGWLTWEVTVAIKAPRPCRQRRPA